MTINIKNKEQWEEKFLDACVEGDLKNIRYLCQKQYLDLGWGDIHWNNEEGFCAACEGGHLEVVKYLLTSPELKEAGHTFADLHVEEEVGLYLACQKGHVEVVKYLLTSPELIEAGHAWANPYVDEEGFGLACRNEHWEVVRWLVMDYELKETKDIKKIIKDHAKAQDYFRARQERKELEKVMNPPIHTHGWVDWIKGKRNSLMKVIQTIGKQERLKKEMRTQNEQESSPPKVKAKRL